MRIINKTLNESGGYSPILTWYGGSLPKGYAEIPETINTDVFYEYNGFVILTIELDIVTAIEPNIEAWEAWKSSIPTPSTDDEDEPKPDDNNVTWDELAAAYNEGVNSI